MSHWPVSFLLSGKTNPISPWSQQVWISVSETDLWSKDLQYNDGNMGARTAESVLTASAIVEVLSTVSAYAVPGLVDALLLTTQCSPSSLLVGLLERFPDVYKVCEKVPPIIPPECC